VAIKRRIVFVTTNPSWGGSEELWSRTALTLASNGLSVGASISFSRSHKRIVELATRGVDIQVRPSQYSLFKRAWQRGFIRGKSLPEIQIEKFWDAAPIALVVISDGLGFLRSTRLFELCVEKKLPFAAISQINAELFWPDDETASRLRKVLPVARRCYFVSKANRRLFEKQIGIELSNAEIVCNPFNVDRNARPPWPQLNDGAMLQFASVARLEPLLKGQDILLEALADPVWKNRRWCLTLYGEGPMKDSIERMIQRLGLQDRASFAGYVTSVENIWLTNHVLVMPSRYEGMPLAMVEAMLCARPIVATDVAGHSEIVEDEVTGFLADAPTVPSLRRALERLWAKRAELKAIGEAAANSIRKYIPTDPICVFAEKLETLC
jgi:glycosyltransferase involved in cell wall biosynthesis